NSAEPEDQMRLRVSIAKGRQANYISIYDIKAFVADLTALTAEEQFLEFAKLSNHGTATQCIVFTEQAAAASSLFGFSLDGNVAFGGSRKEVLEKSAYVCHFAQSDTIPFIPDDFDFGPNAPSALAPVAEKLKTILAIVFVADRAEINGNKLNYFIKGYKTIPGMVDLNNLNLKESVGDVYALYQWIYSGGAVSDKAGLARNVLSLNLDEGQPFVVPKWTIGGVLSNYEIYLKSNVKQYIEAKGKAETSVAELCSKMLQCVDSLTASFKGNLAGFFALFASVVIANATKSGNLRDIFTPSIMLLGASSVGVSALYLILSVIFLHIGVHRLKKAYERLKARFLDVLVKEDLERILQQDQEYQVSLGQVRIGFYSVVVVWITVLLIILLVLLAGERMQLQLKPNPFSYLVR
ncbi:MAG TPA: hypothetical protein VFA15_05820, partial [Nitrososphaera sp.]|nr:hypothetical protein [Nitrososphaera sp.]